MEAKSFLVRNFSQNSTDEQRTTDAQIGITAGVLCILWLIVLAAQAVFASRYSQKICGTAIKRLVIGLTASAMLYSLVLTLHLVRYYYPELQNFCKAQGFLTHYFVSVHGLFTVCICLILFYKVLKVTTPWKFGYCEAARRSSFMCCKRRISKLEAVVFVAVFALPLLFDWIPFTTDSYGPSGPYDFCWFYVTNCSALTCTAGLWEEIWLSSAPLGLITVLTFVLFTVSLCLFGYGVKTARVEKLALIEVGITHLVLLLTLLIVVLLDLLSPIHSFTLQQFTVVSVPIAYMLIPLTLLITVHLPLSSMIACVCKKYQLQSHAHGEYDQATLHRSSDWSGIQQPSHTTWDPLHSSVEVSEVTSLARDKQQQNYGSGAINC